MVWLYFDPLNRLADSNVRRRPSREIMNSGAGFPFQFREGSISSLHWCKVPLTFQKPKHHFIMGKEESHKSIKLSLHFWVPRNCTYDDFTEKDGGEGVFDKGTPSRAMAHLGSVTPSFFVLSVTQVQFFIPPTPPHPGLYATYTLQYFLVALCKSGKKATRRVSEELRKPQVGMWSP